MKTPRQSKPHGKTEHRMTDFVDRLAEFEKFQAEVLPMLQEDVLAGVPPEELRKKYATLLEARKISLGLAVSTPPAVALAAIRDVQDRHEGKAVETKVVTHKHEGLKDEQLDAVLKSEIEDLKDMLN